mmetsp:Transcript_22121/g.55357  ORF Transcript_22121/g.55357 Transcript_22121/m.55357 type:complete len:214 (-) Transcript_22121:105-746(-)
MRKPVPLELSLLSADESYDKCFSRRGLMSQAAVSHRRGHAVRSIAGTDQILSKGERCLLAIARILGSCRLLVVQGDDDLCAGRNDTETLLRTVGHDNLDVSVTDCFVRCLCNGVLLAANPEPVDRTATLCRLQKAALLVDRDLLGAHVVLHDILLVVLLVDQAPPRLVRHGRSRVHLARLQVGQGPGAAVALIDEPLLDGGVPASLLLGHCAA